MRETLALYGTLLRVSIAASIQYRASGMIWMIGSIVEPVILLSVWSVAAHSNGGQIGGQGPHELAAYYIALMLVDHFTFSWIIEVFQYRIQHGDLSFSLLRPLHPIHSDLADNIAYKLVMAVVMLPAALLLAIVFQPRLHTDARSLLCACIALPLAFALRFCFDWTLALSAFWTTRVSAVNRIYYALLMFMSGNFAPVGLLPLALRRLAAVLPFYYLLGFPVELMLGRLHPAQAYRGLCMQFGWLVIAITMLAGVWRIAVRRFSAVGS